jgi:hypothetical protein
MTISLVEDPNAGDSFFPPAVGEPVSFTYGSHTFQGLLQQYTQTGDINGNPLYEVMLVGPSEILSGAQVILGSFRGATGAMPNLLNAYGFWENRMGFGGALTNNSGMLWNAPFDVLKVDPGSSPGSIEIVQEGTIGIKAAIEYLTNFSGDYGGPLQFRGHFYNVDLGNLPIPPVYYRVGGTSRDILSIVSEICQDGGHDYICYLDGHTIKFKTVSRIYQQTIGAISTYVNAQPDVTTKAVGIELRNDVTNAVLLGGDVRQLYPLYNYANDDMIWPFWGMNDQGLPIVGHGSPEAGVHEFDLNCAPIADIMGGTKYHCTIPELRLAAVNYDSWAAWVMRHEPEKAEIINLVGAMDSDSDLFDIFGDLLMQRDLIAAREEAAKAFGGMNDEVEENYWTKRAQRVYNFVSTYANEYYGRKFLVKIPFFVYWKVVEGSTEVVASEEPCESAYLPEASLPLSLMYGNEDMFLTEDGQFECFVLFDADSGIDIEQLDPNSTVIQGNGVYVRARVDTSLGVVYPAQTIFPYCVIELDRPVVALSPDPLGGVSDLAVVLGLEDNPQILQQMVGFRQGDFPIRIAPPAYRPRGVALPMKSNRDSYGPWGTFPPFGPMGVAGKVSFERDESLTPWEYGGYDSLQQAAAAKLAGAASNLQEAETGSLEQVGMPIISLGDSLIAGGPQVTSIDVSVGVDGVKTSYRMQTFSPRFGVFSKTNADRIRQMGIAAQQVRRSLRTLFHQRETNQRVAVAAQIGFMQNASRAIQQRTPHDILYGRMAWSEKLQRYRTVVSSSTLPEAVANARADNPDLWEAAAAMSLEGLLRPFSTNATDPGPVPGRGDYPHFGVIESHLSTTIPSVKTLDPLGTKNDLEIMTWDQTYPGEMHTLKAQAAADKGVQLADGTPMQPADFTNARLLGLRGPMVMVGWGYEYTGKPIPNQAVVTGDPANPPLIHNWSDNFADDHRLHPEYWKAGPIDLRYDMWRQCWTIPTILIGKLDAALTAGPTKMTITLGPASATGPADKIDVYNVLGGPSIAANTLVIAGYYPLTNRWYAIAATCPA